MTPATGYCRPPFANEVSSIFTEPQACAATAVPNSTRGASLLRALMLGPLSEPVGEETHDASPDNLAERVLAMLDAEDVEGVDADLCLVAEEAIADASVEQRVRGKVI